MRVINFCNMKTAADIRQKIHYLKDRLGVLDELKLREMDKPLRARNYDLLKFLSKERTYYVGAIKQFEWVLEP